MEKSITLRNCLIELEKLTVFLDEVIEGLELDFKLGMNIQLVLEEAVANVIMFASPAIGKHDLLVKVHADVHGISFWVEDNGILYDPTELLNVDITLPPQGNFKPRVNTYLASQIMDEVVYTRLENQNRLYMYKSH